MSGSNTSMTCQRSISSQSPPAVGKSRTGRPKCPQRTSDASVRIRSECQVLFCLTLSGGIFLPPLLHALPEELGELGDLVRREQRLDLLLEGAARDRRAEELPGDLVEPAEVGLAEVGEAIG